MKDYRSALKVKFILENIHGTIYLCYMLFDNVFDVFVLIIIDLLLIGSYMSIV